MADFQKIQGLYMTEFEESLAFDDDDPDFAPINSASLTMQTVCRSAHFTNLLIDDNKCKFFPKTFDVCYKVKGLLSNF